MSDPHKTGRIPIKRPLPSVDTETEKLEKEGLRNEIISIFNYSRNHRGGSFCSVRLCVRRTVRQADCAQAFA